VYAQQYKSTIGGRGEVAGNCWM